jgi:general secretion pathway protein H
MADTSDRINYTLHPSPHTSYFSVSFGFTLFELLVVLVIIGLMSAVVIPKLSGHLKSITVKTAAKKVGSALRFARNMAVSKKASVLTVFDLETHQLSIFVDQPSLKTNDDPKEESAQNGILISKNVYALPEGTQFESIASNPKEKISISFYPNGSSSGGKILVTNNKKKKLLIQVDSITGSTKVSE